MRIYYAAETGEIAYTVQLGEDFPYPPGTSIEVPDGTKVDPVSQIVEDGFLIPRVIVTALQRETAQDLVTKTRGLLRSHFITDLPGQDMVYLEKRSEAIAFLAFVGPTEALFPMVYAEVGITAPTAYEVAQVWINMSDMWRSASTVIEAATLMAGKLIQEATTPGQIDAALLELETLATTLLSL